MGTLAADITSQLSATPPEIWRVVSTMAGVNAELHPWIHMSAPPVVRGLSLAALIDGELDVPSGHLFSCWILAMGVVPIDRHRLGIERIWQGGADEVWGFRERSSSWLEREWIHERTIRSNGPGAELRDRVWVAPRVRLLTPLIVAIVRRLFAHRHRTLRQRFGE